MAQVADNAVVTLDRALVDAFAAFPTAMVSDAMDELGLFGVINGVEPRLLTSCRVAGLAMTARFAPKEKDPNAWRFGGGVGKPLEQVLKTMANGQIVVIDLGGTKEAAPWGGLSSRIAQQRGVLGTLVWGACRDLEEIREVSYPVWSTGVCPRRSRNEFTFGDILQPVTIGANGVTVRTGDVLLADLTGVICIPAERAAEVLEVVRGIAKSEEAVEQQIDQQAIVNWDDV